ncbi:Crp/Fnr family transcriptional regulator [Roseomonas sp. PWR1]|uniref:Crp/Fnr family transcriptional regulator n=1 Tax=Roseomonas nitratireducens TaxID=2820810 RepID=A0ABS4ARM4_9PROT|nr:Crp/Fnr family transcriptional regulator [Neoroseomonas nitratireducens]MBP0463481.1 Crp/Fnr family transcriptional regulator [Neoroseomonas nitratireducens]
MAGRPAGMNAPRRAETLAVIPFFSGIAPELALRHGRRAHWLTAEAGRLILDFDDPSDDVFFVLSGSVRISVRTPGGRELILDDVPAGRFFGEMAAIDGAPRSASVIALHRSRICRLPGAAFMALMAEAPDLSRRLMQVLTSRIRETNARMLELTSLDIRHRLYAELLRRSNPAGAGGERAISPPPVQQIIALRIGARREAVSREIARLLRDGVLERTRGALVIRAPAMLERALAEAATN